MIDVQLFISVFVTLFVIMDPPGTVPIFLALTRSMTHAQRARAAWQALAVSFGVVVGANFAVTDGIIGGVEFQGDTYWNGGYAAYDALALGRIGGFVSDNAMLYGDLGAGVLNGAPVYAFGGGVELGMTDQVSIRGDLQGLGVGAEERVAEDGVAVGDLEHRRRPTRERLLGGGQPGRTAEEHAVSLSVWLSRRRPAAAGPSA